jgi:ornithine carbamoyltransferase
MHMKHMLSLSGTDLDQEDFLHLVERGRLLGTEPGLVPSSLLSGKSIGIYFRQTSTRTRTSFAVAAVRLGACPIIYGPSDLQTNTGESLEDTVAVLSKYLDGLVVRTPASITELRILASAGRLPIVNAMTSDEHPTQALADLTTLTRHFGSLSGLRLLYCGEGNNTASALAYAICRTKGMQAQFCTPPGYGLPDDVVQQAGELSKRFGGTIRHSAEPPERSLAGWADVVYTTRWQTTGTTKSDPSWRVRFAPYRISSSVFERLAAGQRAVFMHDLPAVRGEECDGEVLDGLRSIALIQAQQKLYTAVAVLEWCASGH